MIDITGVDLHKFVKEAYALSKPQGLGLMHFQEGALDDKTVEEILSCGDSRIAASMDYVHGRAVKMVVFKKDDRLEIRDSWFDHSDSQLRQLLQAVQVCAK